MSRLFFPLLLVAVAVGLFVLYINPEYQSVKALAAQNASYDEALTRSQELRAVRDQLLAKRNTFAAGDVQKLERMLPDNVDNIRLIIDINNVAAQHGLTLSDVELDEVSSAASERSTSAVGTSGDSVGSVAIGFSLSASYEDLLVFLADLERSLRIIDIETLEFTVPDQPGALPSYDFTIRTYWLK